MTDIIVHAPSLRNPIWSIPEDKDYAFVDLLREVCLKSGLEPKEYEVHYEGGIVPLGQLCLNHLVAGDTVNIVSR